MPVELYIGGGHSFDRVHRRWKGDGQIYEQGPGHRQTKWRGKKGISRGQINDVFTRLTSLWCINLHHSGLNTCKVCTILVVVGCMCRIIPRKNDSYGKRYFIHNEKDRKLSNYSNKKFINSGQRNPWLQSWWRVSDYNLYFRDCCLCSDLAACWSKFQWSNLMGGIWAWGKDYKLIIMLVNNNNAPTGICSHHITIFIKPCLLWRVQVWRGHVVYYKAIVQEKGDHVGRRVIMWGKYEWITTPWLYRYHFEDEVFLVSVG